jgi:hypothetical protein
LSEGARLNRLVAAGSQDAARAMRVEMARLASALELPKDGWRSHARHALVRDWHEGWAQALADYARTPSRLYWDWARVDERRLEPLAAALAEALQGRPELPRGLPSSVRVMGAGPVEASPLQVRGAVMSVLREVLGARLDADDPELRVAVRVEAEALVVGEDLAGSLSHHGQRPKRQQAPLREHLAAQMVALSGWRPATEAFVDPMCGSGTLLAEAIGWAKGLPIRRTHRFGLPVQRALRPELEPRVIGSEPDRPRRRAAEETLSRLGGKARLLGHRLEDLDIELPEAGIVLTNPPYGERLEDGEEARRTLEDLRTWFMTLGRGWRLGLIAPRELVHPIFGRQPKMQKVMPNGPLMTSFLLYESLLD